MRLLLRSCVVNTRMHRYQGMSRKENRALKRQERKYTMLKFCKMMAVLTLLSESEIYVKK
jgi:hypothetical protein